jgi:hypothetical protein
MGLRLIMTNGKTSLDNLISDPSFDFLNNLVSEEEPDFDICTPYEMNNFNCSYYDIESFNSKFRVTPNFSIMTLNIQSISAKFSELKELIISLSMYNTSPDIICLQELWQFNLNQNFQLPGYGKLIYRLRADGVQGGGGRLFCQDRY